MKSKLNRAMNSAMRWQRERRETCEESGRVRQEKVTRVKVG